MSISIMKQDARVPATHVLVILVLHVHIMDSVLYYPEYIEIKTLLCAGNSFRNLDYFVQEREDLRRFTGESSLNNSKYKSN